MSTTEAARPDSRPRNPVWLTLPEVLVELDVQRGTFDHWRRREVRPQMK